MPIVTYALILVAELFLQRVVSRRAGEAGVRIGRLLRGALRETAIGLHVFCWSQPFRSLAYPDRPAASSGSPGVVLVHGFFCNRGVWNGWMKALIGLDVPFIAVNLEPPFDSIDAYMKTIDDAVRKLTSSTGLRPIVVGHSMGGLAARAWANAVDGEPATSRIMTIGSPHHGTMLSRYARSANARQMYVGSAWLASLASSEPADRAQLFTCFYSDYDNVIVPASSARMPRADNRFIPRRTHIDLITAPEIFAELVRQLQIQRR